MAAPKLSHTGQQLYDSHAPLATEDERYGYALAHFLQALALPVDEAADLSRDGEDGSLGWGQLFDVDHVPAKFLPYLGQFVGIDVPGTLTEEGQRLRLREIGNRARGSASAIRGAARQWLIRTGKVYLIERHGSPWRFTVSTLADETPETDWDPRRPTLRATPGLVSLWPFDNPATDTSTPDVVGTRHAQRASADTQPLLGEPPLVGSGGATRFTLDPGKPSSRWVIPGNALTSPSFSISAWVRLDNIGGNTGLFSLARTVGQYGALFYVSGSSPETARLAVQIMAQDGTNPTNSASSGSFPLGELVHVALTYDEATQTALLYQDGVQVGGSLTTTYQPPPPNATMYVAFYEGGAPHMEGVVDELALFDRALTPAEVAAIASPPASATTHIVYDAVTEQKPAGMKFVHEVIRGGSYRTLRATHASYAEVASIFTTYRDVRADPSRQQ